MLIAPIPLQQQPLALVHPPQLPLIPQLRGKLARVVEAPAHAARVERHQHDILGVLRAQEGDEACRGGVVAEGEEGRGRVLAGEVHVRGRETGRGGGVAREERAVDRVEGRCWRHCGAAGVEDAEEDWWRRG